MGELEYRETTVIEMGLAVEYDLADAIYAACLVESLREGSPFYFMDPEDGGTSLYARVQYQR